MVLFRVVTVALAALLATVANAAVSDQLCMVNTKQCTSRFSGYNHMKFEITDLTTQLLDQSFDFLLLSTAFNQHHKNRPGFEKLYRNIADQAWADTMALMKYQSKRGYRAALNANYTQVNSELRSLADPVIAEELSSLQMAMEYEKEVAKVAHAIHKKSSVAHNHPAQYDPDVAHFFDEQIIKGRSGTVRKLTGYIHMLNGILKDTQTAAMGLNLFDQYLNTVE